VERKESFRVGTGPACRAPPPPRPPYCSFIGTKFSVVCCSKEKKDEFGAELQ
jgi:hypothetical protein